MSIRGKVRPTGTYIGLTSGASAAVSEAGEARIRYNTALNRAELSENGGPYFPFGASSGATVATLSALSALPDATMSDGSIVAVRSLMAVWQLRSNGTDAPDGITIVPTSSGVGRWYRMRAPNQFWHSQINWHINPATGDDENQGNTALVPLATFAEFVRRMGPGRIQNNLATITVYIDDDLTEDIEIPDIAPASNGAYINIQGSRTVLYSGSVTGTTAWNPALGDIGTITDAAIPVSWTASGLVGQMIVMTSGAASGYIGWVEVDQAAKTAVVSRIYDPVTYAVADPGVGDTFDVVSLTTITGNVAIQNNVAYLQFIDLHIDATVSHEITLSRAVVFTTCSITGGALYSSWAEVQLAGCRFNPLATIYSRSNGSVYIDACALECPIRTYDGGRVLIWGDTVSQCVGATSVSSYGNIIIYSGYWWGHFDNVAAVYGLRLGDGTDRPHLDGLFWGLNNTSDYGVVIPSGVQAVYTTLPTYGPNVVNDVLVGSIADTYAALPIADGTLLAGLVTAT